MVPSQGSRYLVCTAVYPMSVTAGCDIANGTLIHCNQGETFRLRIWFFHCITYKTSVTLFFSFLETSYTVIYLVNIEKNLKSYSLKITIKLGFKKSYMLTIHCFIIAYYIITFIGEVTRYIWVINIKLKTLYLHKII